jgi:hypothetical protein
VGEDDVYIIKGIHNISKFVAGNLQWWKIEVCDGVNVHLLSQKANEERLNSRILSLNEEGNVSHVNQAHGTFVAKNDKTAKMESSSIMRFAFKVDKKIANQWSLVSIGLYAVHDTTHKCWTKYFHQCNMDAYPCFISRLVRLSQSLLQSGEPFKHDTFDTIPSDHAMYVMIPPM